MPDPSPIEVEIRARVLEAMLADRALGQEPDLARYQRQIGSHQALVAAQFDEIMAAIRDAAANAVDDAATLVPGEERVQSASLEVRMQRLAAQPALDLVRYRIEREVAKGGMGAILRVRDQSLGRRLAMKVILGKTDGRDGKSSGDTPSVDPHLVERFLDEAQVTGQLDHPGVVPVHDLGLDQNGRAYFTMRLVRGRTVGEVFQLARDEQDGWTRTRALEVVLKICDTMAYAHAKGVLHRDLKPANVMVGRYGEVYVMDWGLAKVVGQPDRRDLRIQPTEVTTLSGVHTNRAADAESDPDSPLVTMDGTVVGTPSYMPPEQAEGRIEELGPQADVYAVGAMLYQLLTGWQPYVKPGARVSPYTVLHAVMDGPPKPVHEIDKTVPPELVAVCERAMARDKAVRYADMDALATDLRAYLEQRVVSAYRTGALVELKMWVRRNRGLAVSLLAVFVVAIAGVAVASTLAREANARQAEFDQLSSVVYLTRAVAAEQSLYPAWPEKAEAMRDWLHEDAAHLIAAKPQLVATVRELEARALPRSEEERAAERLGHPRFVEWEAMHAKLASLRAAQTVRDGAELVLPELPEELGAKNASELNDVAWPLVDWDETKRVWGREEHALAVARAALAKLEPDDTSIQRYMLLDTLAWAYFANGQDDKALAASGEARELARGVNAKVRKEYSGYLQNLEQKIEAVTADKGPALLARLESELAALEMQVDERQVWRFEDEAQEFLHSALSDALPRIEAFEKEQLAGVKQRWEWAEQVERLTRAHPNAQVTWAAAAAAIAAADGVTASTLYAAQPITDLQPQTGLVPIGMNPKTLLWEFYHLRSAWNPASGMSPAALPIPSAADYDAEGELPVEEGTGIIFVLLPGGTFQMGSQDTDPNGANYDRQHQDHEILHEETVAPFFLARHELTRAQWQRLSGHADPSRHALGTHVPNDAGAIGGTHPVENVSWTTCDDLLGRHGLTLPGEVEWEYGCRAGTTTPWWTGRDTASLGSAANVLDRKAVAQYPAWGQQEGGFDDGWIGSAPVGSYRSNGFGLFDVHGNVSEWCRHGDPGASDRIQRGGSFFDAVGDTRSSRRSNLEPTIHASFLGARAARARF